MKSQKYTVQLVAFNVFRLSLYGLATVIALCIVFASPSAIKRAFTATNAYSRFVPLNIESAVKLNQNSGSAPIKDPAIQKIITDSFPATKLKLETEKVIDSTYAWLNGQTTKPDFVVDFTPNIEQLATKLSAYGITRLKAQPICEISMQSVDPFTSTCRPENFDYAGEQISLANAIRNNNGILSKTIYTVDDLPKTTTGKTLIQQYSYAPRVFKILLYAPFVLFCLAAISAILAIGLDRKKHDATYRVGTSVVGANVFLILSPLFYIYVLPRFFPSLNAESTSGGGGAVIGDAINKISTDFSNQLIVIGSIMLLVGVIIIVAERATRPKSKYVKVAKKAGLTTSETPRNKQGKRVLNQSSVPIQTSEGKKQISKYHKNKRYRKIAKKEF